MKPFWALAARNWTPSLPSWEMLAKVGAERVAKLHAAGILHEVAIRPYDTVSCLGCRWNARVIWEPQGAVAICTADMPCEAVELGPAPYRLATDERELVRLLARR